MLRVWEGYEAWASWSSNFWNGYWQNAAAGASQSFIVGRFGGNSIAWRGSATSGGNSGFAWHHKYGFISPSSNDFVLGLAIRCVTHGTGDRTVAVISEGGATGTQQFQVVIGPNVGGFHSVLIKRAGTTVATAAAAFSSNAWHYLEVKGRIHDTTGYAVVRVDGVEVLNSTGLDTRNAGTGLWDGVYFGPSINDNTQYTIDIDDMYLVEIDGTGAANDFLGECREAVLLPTAEGAASDFTPSAGTNNALNVDEQTPPDDDTTYNASSTVGHKDTNVVGDIPTTPGTIHGTKEYLRARKTDAGVRTARQIMRIASTDYEGSTINLIVTYETTISSRVVSPATSSAFTETEINGMEIGYKVQA